MNTNGEFQFSIDGTYENEKGAFRVVSIERDQMVIRWENGEEVSTSVALQGRIQQRREWEKSKQEQVAAAAAAKPAAPKPKARKPKAAAK